MTMPEVVWLTEERTYGVLILMGAHFSVIRYYRNGVGHDMLIENEEYEFWEDRAIEYGTDDD